MMKHLCRKRHVTIPELAREFGVSKRTVQRDIEVLTFLLPIYVKTGRYEGGVYVCGDYTMDRMYMEPEEIKLLNKVKELFGKNLSQKELKILEMIIKNYTKQESYCIKQDASCPH